MWLKEIDTKEKIRLKETQNIIINQSRLLREEIETSLKIKNYFSDSTFIELENLNVMHEYLFPEKALVVDNGIKIAEYLKKFKE